MKKKLQIECRNLEVTFPLYDRASRSVKNRLIRGNKTQLLKKFTALKNVDITINQGERVGLLGKNGAGKSTLLRTLAGVYIPGRGSVKISGEITSLFDVGVGLDPDASGYDNIPLLMASRGVPLGLIDKVRSDVEKFTELGEALFRPVRTYSAGMRLRIAFAIATFRSADVLLMDEVIGVGDVNFREKSTRRVKGLMKKAGTLVLASHSTGFLKAYCDRGVCFDKGEITFDGTIQEAIRFHGENINQKHQ